MYIYMHMYIKYIYKYINRYICIHIYIYIYSNFVKQIYINIIFTSKISLKNFEFLL